MNVLERILADVRTDLAKRMAEVDLAALERLIAAHGPRRSPGDVASLLRGRDQVRVISEVKRASPARGTLSAIPAPGALAREYVSGGATAISVLTEGRRFSGSLADLGEVRAAVDVPLLRKDFVVDPYQLAEAAAHGADLVLLIVAALGQSELTSLIRIAGEYGLLPLVEVHDTEELDRALSAGATVIGANARDLRTLEVNRETCGLLVERIPADLIRVAESGIRGPEDVVAYAEAGADAVLVGSALVTSVHPGRTVASLVAAGRGRVRR